MQIFKCTKATQFLLTKFKIPFTLVAIHQGDGKKVEGIALTDSAIQAINAFAEFLKINEGKA